MKIYYLIPSIGCFVWGVIYLVLYKKGWGISDLGPWNWPIHPKKVTEDQRLNLIISMCIAFLAFLVFFLLIFFEF